MIQRSESNRISLVRRSSTSSGLPPGDDRGEAAVAALLGLEQGLRRRPVEVGAAVEAVDLHEDRAGLRGPAPAQHRRDALDVEPPEMGRDPEIGAQAHASVAL